MYTLGAFFGAFNIIALLIKIYIYIYILVGEIFFSFFFSFFFFFFWFLFKRCSADRTDESHVLKQPCRVRMHYGHPDVFDRIFHISRGGISKASRVINISEDIYAGKHEG